MSIQLIQKYYTEIDKIIRYGGSRNESSLRKPFQDLLEGYARAKKGTWICPDGVLKDTQTTLCGVPAEKFNTYQFAEYKESVIKLLGRMCTM